MKTYILLSVLIYGLCSSIYAAPSRKSRPAESVQLFYAAMSRGNIETAKKYVLSSKLWEKLNKLEASLKQIPELKKDIRKDYLPLTRAKYLTQSVRKDQGKVTYSYVKDKKTVTETAFLRFVDGKWRIEEILKKKTLRIPKNDLLISGRLFFILLKKSFSAVYYLCLKSQGYFHHAAELRQPSDRDL